MFKRIIAGMLSTALCTSAITTGDIDETARAVTANSVDKSISASISTNFNTDETNTKFSETDNELQNIQTDYNNYYLPAQEDKIESVALGDNINADIYSNGLLHIYGCGKMYDFKKSPFKNPSLVKQVIFDNEDIENGLVIDSIGAYTFAGCTALTELTIPDTVTSMGIAIFEGCTNLNELTLPYAATAKTCTDVGGSVNDNCSVADLFIDNAWTLDNSKMDFSDYAIEKITITGGQIIPKYAFSHMTGLKEIDLSNSGITIIDYAAFNDCTSLSNLKLSKTLKTIGSNVFCNCKSMKVFNLNDGLETLDKQAFKNCTGITSFIVPETVTSMGIALFEGCTNLSELTLPYAATAKTCTDIGGSVNDNCSVADLFIDNAWTLDNSKMDFSDYAIEKITITGGQIIPQYAFSHMTDLKEIDFSRTEIVSIGDGAFWNCNSIENIKMPNTVTSIGSYAYYNTPITSLPDNGTITSVGDYAFAECKNLSEFTIPKSYQNFGKHAFSNCKNIKKLIIPSNVMSMGIAIFEGCTNLNELTLPYAATAKTCTDVGESVNDNCSVADLFIDNAWTLDNSKMDFSDYAIEKITITGGQIIPKYAFSHMTGLKEIDLSNSGITIIDYAAFNDCTSLSNLKLSKTLKTIGSNVFCNCKSMKVFNLNDGLETLDKQAFKNCTGITSFIVPETVTSMGIALFEGCTNLSELTLPYAATAKTCTDVGGSVNDNCSVADLFIDNAWTLDNSKMDFSDYAIEKINITGGEKIPRYAFSSMTTIKEVNIFNSEINLIEENAFKNCVALKSIYLPESVKKTNTNAFIDINADLYFYNSKCEISDKSVSDNYNGTIHGFDGSTADIFANSNGLKFVAFNKEIVIGSTSISLVTGETYQIKSDYNNLEYKSSDSTVAKVDNNGLISAVSIGNAVIEVKAENDSICTINVKVTKTTTTTTTTTTAQTTTTTEPIPPKPQKLNIQGKMKVKEMNIDDIKQAGIDVNDSDNCHAFCYETKLGFIAREIILIDAYIDLNGTPMEVHTANVDGRPCKVIGYDRTETEVMYMIVTGECKWLKEFYDVQLVVINRGNNGESLTDCTAELKVPDGLTLINCKKEQILGDLTAGEAFNIHWYLRGDKEGDYILSADFKGTNRGEEFTYPFLSSNKLHVYAGNALKMKIEAPMYSEYDEDYVFTIIFENVSDRPIYNIEHYVGKYEQCSIKTINTYYNAELVSHEVFERHLQGGDFDQKYKIDTLNPGEKVVAVVKIHDIWRSLLEQENDSKKLKASYTSLIASVDKNPYLMGIGFFADMYYKILDSMDVRHILKMVDVATLEGSTTEIPYEVIIIENDKPGEKDPFFLKQCLDFVIGNIFSSDINKIYQFGNTLGKHNPLTYIEEHCCDDELSDEEKNKLTEKYSYKYAEYLAKSSPYISEFKLNKANMVLKNFYYYKVYKPQGYANVEFYVTRANGTIQFAPNSVSTSQNRAEYDDFDIEVVYGDYSVKENGHIVLNSDAIIRVMPKTPNIRATVGAMTEDGKEVINYPVEVIDEHECKGEYMIIAQPSEDEGATMAAFCETCQELIECAVLPIEDTAMLSNGQSYQNIKDALADAAESDEELKLYIFGNVNIVEDVTVSDNLTIVITPETKINVADGCKFVAKGDVKDFSGYNYDLSGNAPLVSQTSTTSASVTTTTTTTTTTVTTSVTKTETYATTTSSTTTENAITSSITSTNNTPTTTDASIEDTSLPQTGIPISFDIFAVITAIITLLAGTVIVIRSRKEKQ